MCENSDLNNRGRRTTLNNFVFLFLIFCSGTKDIFKLDCSSASFSSSKELETVQTGAFLLGSEQVQTGGLSDAAERRPQGTDATRRRVTAAEV